MQRFEKISDMKEVKILVLKYNLKILSNDRMLGLKY